MVSERSQVNPERKFSDDLDGLLLYSKELGLDRMQIQAAGGNTSCLLYTSDAADE